MSKSKNPFPDFLSGTYNGVPVEATKNNGWYRLQRILPTGRSRPFAVAYRWHDIERFVLNGTLILDGAEQKEPDICPDILEVI